MTARVRCRHLATLGADAGGFGVCADSPCPVPLTESPWTFSGSPVRFRDVLAELAGGCSLGGALLRVAERFLLDGPVFLADGEQIAVAAQGPGLLLRTVGGGAFAVAAGRVDEPEVWTDVPAGTLLLLDPCGVTTTHFIQPRREATA